MELGGGQVQTWTLCLSQVAAIFLTILRGILIVPRRIEQGASGRLGIEPMPKKVEHSTNLIIPMF